MAEETMQKASSLWYEASQAVVQSAFDVQERSVQYAQNSFMDGIETFKNNIEASRRWMQMENRLPDQQESMSSFMDIEVETYKRNVALLQRITEQGTETFKANAGVVRDLVQTLMKKAQDQRTMSFWQ